MEGTGKPVKGSGERQEGVGKSGSDKVTGVGRDVSTFVVRVDGNVQPHELNELLVVSETEESGQVGRVIRVLVNLGKLSVNVDVSEDSAGNVGELGNEVHGVIESGLPVVTLVDTVRVGLGKGRVVVELL